MTDRLLKESDVLKAILGWETDPLDEELERAVKKLPSADVPTWIPAKERLPHDGERILACYDDGWMLAGEFYAWMSFSFIAWMPLPMPYEPKGVDDEA